MQVQRRQFIDIPAREERRTLPELLRDAFYVVIALSIIGYFGYKYSSKLKLFNDRLNVTVAPFDPATVKPPILPDLAPFTTENIIKKIRPPAPGKIVVNDMTAYPEFSEFMEDDAPRRLRLLQHRINPQAIVIESGHYTLTQLYEEIHKDDPESKMIVKLEGNKYLLRMPLGVLIGASLVISDQDTPELLLSKQANAFLVNGGDMFIIKTTVKGWDEVKNAPTKYIDKVDYRPFITSWGGGGLYIASSRIEFLGYLKGKSYGVSYSACTSCLKVNPFLPHATGANVDSYFTDMFYGFYSYEAYDVAIVNNVYEDNVIYAIDPHDRSRRLIIANNKTFGTHYKHGIIVSREVNDSWIFGNHTHHNKGSGIMIDRLSRNNVIANNLSEDNEQDGLTYFESQDNISWGNIFRNNKRNGILARNSWNIKSYNDDILMNGGVAVEAYSVNLVGKELHRDFELDPFTQKADIALYGAKIKTNGSAVFKFVDTDYLDLSNVDISSGASLFPPAFVYDSGLIYEKIKNPKVSVRVETGFKSTDTVKFPTKFE